MKMLRNKLITWLLTLAMVFSISSGLLFGGGLTALAAENAEEVQLLDTTAAEETVDLYADGQREEVSEEPFEMQTEGEILLQEGDTGFGQAGTALAAGTYNLPVSLTGVADHTQEAMIASCVDSAVLTVAEDGLAMVNLKLKEGSLYGMMSIGFSSMSVYTAIGSYEAYTAEGADKTKAEANTLSKGTFKNAQGDEAEMLTEVSFAITDKSWDGLYTNIATNMTPETDYYLMLDYAHATAQTALTAGYTFGSAETVLEAGVYDLPVTVMKEFDTESVSMAAGCVKSAKLFVAEDGSASVKMKLGTIEQYGLISGSAQWKIYPTIADENTWADRNKTNPEKKDATVLKTGTYQDTEGKEQQMDRLISFAVPDNSWDGIYVTMYVEAMKSSPEAYLKLDYANAAAGADYTEEEFEETPAAEYKFGSGETALTEGNHKITASLTGVQNHDEEAMIASCVDSAVLNVAADGSAAVNLKLKEGSLYGMMAIGFSAMSVYTAIGSYEAYTAEGADKTMAEANTISKGTFKNAQGEDAEMLTEVSFALPDNAWDGIYVNIATNMTPATDYYLKLTYGEQGEEPDEPKPEDTVYVTRGLKYGNGKVVNLIDGFTKDGTDYTAVKGTAVTVEIVPDEGWELRELTYPISTTESVKLEVTPVEGQKNQYTFTVPDDMYSLPRFADGSFTYAPTLQILADYKPVLAEGEYEIYYTKNLGEQFAKDPEIYKAAAGENVTFAVKATYKERYCVPSGKYSMNGTETALDIQTEVKLGAEDSVTELSFSMPASDLTLDLNYSHEKQLSVVTVPAGYEDYISLEKAVENDTCIKTRADFVVKVNTLAYGKDARVFVDVAASDGSKPENITVTAGEVKGGLASYTVSGLDASKGVVTVTFDETPDIKNLEDGSYSIHGDMIKIDKTNKSMSDAAIDHTIKLIVKDGVYYLNMKFSGLTIGGMKGYLGRLDYYVTGYTTNIHGTPEGTKKAVTVEAVQLDENGKVLTDDFGTDYPAVLSFPLIQEALDDGYVPLQVFVPIMESLQEGGGTQNVYLKLDWNTVRAFEKTDLSKDGKLSLAKTSVVYSGQAQKPAVTVSTTVDGQEKALALNTDYTVEYADNTNAGTAKVTVKGKGDYTGTLETTFKITPVKLSSATLKKTSFAYNGKVNKPAAVVKAKVNGQTKTLKAGADYNITYKNNKKVGKASAVITGKGNYTGKLTKTFNIVKAKQPMTVKAAKAKTLKLKTLKKKAQAVAKAITVAKNQGKVTYTKVAKGSSKYLTINKKTGKITVKKGTPKGNHKIKVKVKAAGNGSYNAGTRTVTVTVQVK